MPEYVTSANTFEEVQAAYEDAASYDVANDVDMCREFVVAGRIFAARLKSRLKQGNHEVEEDPAVVLKAIAAAEAWLGNNDAAYAGTRGRGMARAFGFSRYRG